MVPNKGEIETKRGNFSPENTKNGKISKNTLLEFQKNAIRPSDKQNQPLIRSSQYYNLLQRIRSSGYSAEAWERWVLYILRGIEETAEETVQLVEGISSLMKEYKLILREVLQKAYSHDLLNCLFYSPYTKIEHLEKVLRISRPTAVKYLEAMVKVGILTKARVWRQNYYINTRLVDLLAQGQDIIQPTELIKGDLLGG